jgi:preprotein translocase subunit SecD
VRAVWLVLLLVLAGCSTEVTGAPAKDDSPVVGPVDLVVPIEMHPVTDSGTITLPDPQGEQLTLAEPIMTVERLNRAEVKFSDTTWVLLIQLTDDDAATFADWTANHVSEQLAMVVDGEVVIAPEIQGAITDGNVQIAGNYTQDEMRALLDKITGRS